MAGLYIHIPFCHSKCAYCDFFSTPRVENIDAFLAALIKEFELREHEISEPYLTVYLGGGTPSILPVAKLKRLCASLPVTDAVEFTIEANPEDITADTIKAWRDIGINRVSMGIQSFDDNQLKIIRRRHSSSEARSAIETILAGGITNLSCDLIYGLPEQSVGSWERSLETLLSYNLPHISAYCLSYEPGTALYARMTAGKIAPTDDNILEKMYAHLCQRSAEAGYEHYEISNFARAGMRSRHNSSYWTSTPYLGLGPGAHSSDGTIRRYNTIDLKNYISTSSNTVAEEESEDERFNDLVITSLRTSDGLDMAKLPRQRAEHLNKAAARFIAAKSMELDGSRLRINEAEWFRSDAILRELIVV